MKDPELRRAWMARLKGLEELDALSPGWFEIVGEPGSATPFRQWLAKQPADYQSRMNHSESAPEIAEAIRLFRRANREVAEGEDPGMSFTMHGVKVMTITEDGRIVTGPLFAHADHASVTFLMALTDIAPSFLHRIKEEALAWQRRAIDAEAELVKLKKKLN